MKQRKSPSLPDAPPFNEVHRTRYGYALTHGCDKDALESAITRGDNWRAASFKEEITLMATGCSRWRDALLTALLVAFLGAAAPVQSKERLFWLLRDTPPLTIATGPNQGQGTVDRLLEQIIEGLPEYEHVVLRVNRARSMQRLQEGELACDPMLLRTTQRSKQLTYSTPSMTTRSSELIIRTLDRERFAPFQRPDGVDLHAALAGGDIKVGVVAERSYGDTLDTLIAQAPEASTLPHHGNDAVASLLRMEHVGRIEGVLGYRQEANYYAAKVGLPEGALDALPISGVAKTQQLYMACSNTERGRIVIEKINLKLKAINSNG